MVVPLKPFRCSRVYLHGQYEQLVHFDHTMDFIKKTAKLLKCSTSEILISNEDGDFFYATECIKIPKGAILAFASSDECLGNLSDALYEARIVMNQRLYRVFYQTTEQLIGHCLDKLHIERSQLMLATPQGKTFKHWKTKKVYEPVRFTQEPFIYAWRKN